MKTDADIFSQVSFFQQERKDGGLRTGLQARGRTLLHFFQEGSDDRDPSLQWYVDLRCNGNIAALNTAAEARKWLSENSGLLRDALNKAAEELSGGLDMDHLPWSWSYPNAPKGWTVEVVVSAMRRLPGLEVAKKLQRLSRRWQHYLEHLQPLIAA